MNNSDRASYPIAGDVHSILPKLYTLKVIGFDRDESMPQRYWDEFLVCARDRGYYHGAVLGLLHAGADKDNPIGSRAHQTAVE